MAWQRVLFAEEFTAAHTILSANSADTPTALAISDNNLIGRAGGNIASLAEAAILANILPSVIIEDGSNAFTNPIAGVTPTGDTHLTTKGYVDGLVEGISAKTSVVAATTANGDLGTAYENGDTIDSVVLATDDRILIKNQSSAVENGIYVVQASGAPVRADDYAAGSSAAGTFVWVEEGGQADTGWLCTNDEGSDVVNTNTLTFVQFSGAGQITAGAGMTKSGNTINVIGASASALTINADDIAVNPDNSTIEINGTAPGVLRIKPASITTSEISATAEIASSQLNLDDGTMPAGGINMAGNPINFNGGTAQNMLLDPLASPPGAPGVGQVYYDTASPGLYVYFA
jgi:hypothetical protein